VPLKTRIVMVASDTESYAVKSLVCRVIGTDGMPVKDVEVGIGANLLAMATGRRHPCNDQMELTPIPDDLSQ